jgi:putative tricarboxylic transport membrane protein
MDMEYIPNILMLLAEPVTLLLIMLGVAFGIFVGAMPGLNGAIGVALLMPITYSLSPEKGLLMLGGIYMGATYGGSISAILLNCPGAGEAACTALDGYPLATRGRGKEALYYSILSSSIGSVVGVLTMICFTPLLADVALKFGPPEMFLISVAGLAVVGSLMGKSLSKGFFAVAFGLILSMIGVDSISGNIRLTFGVTDLQAGMNLVPVTVGLFAVAEMLALSTNSSGTIVDAPMKDISVLTALQNVFLRWTVLVKSSIIGTIIGILPGTGGAIGSFIAYGEAKRSSKNQELFGKGNPEGIIAAESANNAAVGGSFVPLLALGIPGSATSAIIFGALTVHGLIPGPKLFVEHAAITYTFMIGMLLTVIMMAVIGVSGVRLFSKVLTLKMKYIIPAVLAFSIIGAFSARNSLFDVGIAIVFGMIGVFFKRNQIPTAPVILGLILGTMTEENMRRCIEIAGAKGLNTFQYIFARPIALVVLLFIVILVYANFKSFFSGRRIEPAGNE